MTTGQNYVGGESHATQIEGLATNPPQAAQNAAQTPSTADSWFSPAFKDLNEDVYLAQSHLLDAVDSFMDYSSPIEIINKMLLKWLTSPPLDLAQKCNRDELEIVLRLVTFLEELRDAHTFVYDEAKLLKSKKGGQAHE